MKKDLTRIVIYAKDIERITGRRLRTCYTILQKIRLYYNKNKNDFVTAKEFCTFLNIDEDLIKDFLAD
jgi:hypothetical protein